MPLRFITTLVVSSLGLLTWGAAYAGAQTRQMSATTAPTQTPITVYQPGRDIANPVLLNAVPPRYPAGAANAGVRGDVELQVVVLPSGVVGDIKVTKGIDHGDVTGFDAAAVDAAKRWLFRPAARNGQPVAVSTTLVVAFRPGGEGAPIVQAFADALAPTTPGLVPPRALTTEQPRYTPAALSQKIEGEVVLEAVIGRDGRVAATRVVKSLDRDLDQQAIDAVKGWTFTPATLDDKPVAARVALILTFRLR